MNLKEAFRYQNKLQRLMDEAAGILEREDNLVRVESTHLRHKVNPEAENETVLEPASSEFAEHINGVAGLLMFLLRQREQLSAAIRSAKQGLDMDFDGEVSLNARRQQLAEVFRDMAQIRGSEKLVRNGGAGFKFNAEGNQVAYRCDLKRVSTINFDRGKIQSYASGLSKKADRISAELDRHMVNTEVDYREPFDVNDTFAQVLWWFLDQNS